MYHHCHHFFTLQRHLASSLIGNPPYTVDQDISWLQKASCCGGWGLSGRVPISSRKQSELMQLLETQEAVPSCSQPAMDRDS